GAPRIRLSRIEMSQSVKLRLFLVPSLFVASLTGCHGAPSTGEPSDTGTPPDGSDMAQPPGIKFIDVENAADLTPEGRFALLQDFESVDGDIYVYDSHADQLEKRGTAANPDPAMM